jgi:hypothetical protein
MSYAPPTLVALADYWKAHGGVPLGIVGDASHVAGGTSYHLGKDHLIPGAYSAILPRDKAGLTNAASAIDLGKLNGTYTELRTFSKWLVAECQAGFGKPGSLTRDIREVIYSPDGVTVWRWDGVNNQHATGPGQGDLSHTTHTHVSEFRDSEFRDKIAAISGYFEPQEVPMDLVPVHQSWTGPAAPGGPLRLKPDRSLGISEYVPPGAAIESFGEWLDPATGNNWRYAAWPVGSRNERWFLRTGPGVVADKDMIAGAMIPPGGGTDPAALAAAELLGKQAGYDFAVAGAVVDIAQPQVHFPPRPTS